MGISVIYPSFKMRVKVISVDMKSGTMNVVFVAIFLSIFFQSFYQKINSRVNVEIKKNYVFL